MHLRHQTAAIGGSLLALLILVASAPSSPAITRLDRSTTGLSPLQHGSARRFSSDPSHVIYQITPTEEHVKSSLKDAHDTEFISIAFAGDGTLVVPAAVYKPEIDGEYTTLERLTITEAGPVSEYKDKIEDEWGDAVQVRYQSSKSEWYLKLKQDGEQLYVLVDAVSDHAVGRVFGNRDSRQLVDFMFNTKNISPSTIDVGTEGVYFIQFHFTSSKYLADSPKSHIVGRLLSRRSYEYDWSMGETPLSSALHITIEIGFDLKMLTNDFTDTRFYFESYAIDNNISLLHYSNNLDFLGTQTIPELPSVGIQVLVASLLTLCVLRLSGPILRVWRIRRLRLDLIDNERHQRCRSRGSVMPLSCG